MSAGKIVCQNDRTDSSQFWVVMGEAGGGKGRPGGAVLYRNRERRTQEYSASSGVFRNWRAGCALKATDEG